MRRRARSTSRSRNDTLVPIGFAAHVRAALPSARHLELDCGHVPQIERPVETHAAIAEFLRATLPSGERLAHAAS
jgi:pimeloyl-ACP methyl ester carboxylesterase